MNSRVKHLQEISTYFITSLSAIYPPAEARSITFWVLEDVLGMSKAKLMTSGDMLIPIPMAEQLEFILHELKQQRPVQYVLGKAWFYGLEFKVTEAVLIPRPETEELVQWVLETCKENNLSDCSIIDLGTGSACIPVSLKKNLPKSIVSALDISADALKIAAFNAVKNGVEVHFIQADLLDIKSIPIDDGLTIIISNPPYVCFSEMELMRKNVLEHEPHLALFVPDTDALLFYRKIAELAFHQLIEGGFLFFEINEAKGAEVIELLQQKGFKQIELRKDLSDKDRMVKAMK